MKFFWTLIIPLTLISCSSKPYREISSDSSRGSVNCYKDMCVGDTVFHFYGKTKTDAQKEIKTLSLREWDCDGTCKKQLIPEANLVEDKIGRRYDDLRSYAKVDKNIDCTYIKNIKFCSDQVVSYLSEDRVLKTAKIFKIFTTETSNVFVLEDSENPEQLISMREFAIMTEGLCFNPRNQLCIGESYGNGLGSEDKIQAYFPSSDEFYIYAGDVKKSYKVSRQVVEARQEGRYEVQYTYDPKISENKSNALIRISNVAKEKCGYEFFGQGIVDKERSGEPKVTNCKKDIQGPGFAHGFYGPSLRTTCDVDYTYYCAHKLQGK